MKKSSYWRTWQNETILIFACFFNSIELFVAELILLLCWCYDDKSVIKTKLCVSFFIRIALHCGLMLILAVFCQYFQISWRYNTSVEYFTSMVLFYAPCEINREDCRCLRQCKNLIKKRPSFFCNEQRMFTQVKDLWTAIITLMWIRVKPGKYH